MPCHMSICLSSICSFIQQTSIQCLVFVGCVGLVGACLDVQREFHPVLLPFLPVPRVPGPHLVASFFILEVSWIVTVSIRSIFCFCFETRSAYV